MLAALILLIGLLLSLFEKHSLFKKPVTVYKVIVILLLFASGVISFYKDVVDGKEKAKDRGKITTLTTQVSSLMIESKKAQREYADSLINYHNFTTELLAKYGLKVDTLTNTVRTMDTSILKEVPPTLTILEPPVFSKLKDENIVAYSLNALNANAHLLGGYYVIINTRNRKCVDTPFVIPGTSNFTTVIPANDIRALSFFIDRIKSDISISDTFMLAMEFLYKSKANKIQTPLRKIYIVFYNNKVISEVISEEFYRIALYLKKYKVWRKFYNL
jgi:hypothetical protein